MRGQSTIEKPSVSARRLKGQSAIEYLMTYGWAILALVIVIGALLSTGVLSPTYLISEECSLGSNIPCKLAIYNQGDVTTVSTALYNGFPYKIRIKELTIYSRADNSVQLNDNTPKDIESGANISYSGNVDYVPSNTIVRYYINLTYVSCAPEVAVPPDDCSDSEHTVVGKITSRVFESG